MASKPTITGFGNMELFSITKFNFSIFAHIPTVGKTYPDGHWPCYPMIGLIIPELNPKYLNYE
jgi:hypothetical protein